MLNEINPDVAPAWHAICLDESRHCGEEFLAKCGGKLYGVYIVDLNSVTYCCELTPSYELNFVGSVPEEWSENSEERESMFDDLMESDAQSPEVSYFHCSVIKAMSEDLKHEIKLDEDEWRDVEDKGYEAAREAYHGSPEFS